MTPLQRLAIIAHQTGQSLDDLGALNGSYIVVRSACPGFGVYACTPLADRIDAEKLAHHATRDAAFEAARDFAVIRNLPLLTHRGLERVSGRALF